MPVSQINVSAAPGDPMSTKLTITDGLEYTEGGTGHMEFDGGQQLDSGDTVHYDSTEATHTVRFFFSFEKKIQGYVVTGVTVNGAATPFVDSGEDSYTIEVGEEAEYNIGINVAQTGAQKYTIIWGNPGADAEEEDLNIKNGRAEILAVYDQNNNLVSEAVSGGTVILDNGAIANGTARISVSDVDLDANKISDFENAAGGAYSISNYLDIDFYNIFYKGKTDSVDVWSNQLHELGGEATITLQLGNDVDVSNIVLVHNIGDGDEYEIIEIDNYDPVAHTITFRTRSFSSFAIATKNNVGAPDSGFMTKGGVSAVATISAVVFASTILTGAAWLVAEHTIKK